MQAFLGNKYQEQTRIYDATWSILVLVRGAIELVTDQIIFRPMNQSQVQRRKPTGSM